MASTTECETTGKSDSRDQELIEYFRQANRDLTLSDLAILIHVRGLGAMSRQDMMGSVDTELQEVREVLIGVSLRRYYDGYCWCHSAQSVDDNQHVIHHEYCQRARALWSNLEVKCS